MIVRSGMDFPCVPGRPLVGGGACKDMVTGWAPLSLIPSHFYFSHSIRLVISFVSYRAGQLHTLGYPLSHVDSRHVDSCHVDSGLGELYKSRLLAEVLSSIEFHLTTPMLIRLRVPKLAP